MFRLIVPQRIVGVQTVPHHIELGGVTALGFTERHLVLMRIVEHFITLLPASGEHYDAERHND